MDIMPNNLKRQYDLYAPEFEAKALEVLRGGWYILGPEVRAFEEEFAAFAGTKYCVGLASGLDALWLSLKALGLAQGDEVIVCASAYIACVMGITIPGGTPVFVEPDEYFNINAANIEAAITPRTKAIMPVHLYGQACNMDAIMATAQAHGLWVVEDCAQSHGALWNGKPAGSFGNAGCFSFYPTKGCGAFGDAGAVVTDDEELANRLRTLRNYGSSKQYHFDEVGANSRLDELQAGLLRVRLAHMDELNAERREIAGRYLAGIQNPLVLLPKTQPHAVHTWHQFVVCSPKRDALRDYLKEKGVGTIIHYPVPPHLSPAYAHLGYKEGAFPIAEALAGEVLSLPMYNGITEDELDYVIDCVNSFAG